MRVFSNAIRLFLPEGWIFGDKRLFDRLFSICWFLQKLTILLKSRVRSDLFADVLRRVGRLWAADGFIGRMDRN